MIDLIAGARPNFVKIAALLRANYGRDNLKIRLIHTGQHTDVNMSEVFFEQLNIPSPEVFFKIESGGANKQISQIINKYDELLDKSKPVACVVVGDVNSTFACALAANKRGVPVVHIEAGIRSFDRSMPEEINRILTDELSDVFFTTSEKAGKNLISVGLNPEKIYFVGNLMIDTLVQNLNNLSPPVFWHERNFEPLSYSILTMHRPSNVDDADQFSAVITSVCSLMKYKTVVFPVHPRVKKHFEKLNHIPENLFLCEPLPYLEFNFLLQNCFMVITDSGGVSEESTYFNVPCVTLRKNTERPETVTDGTNVLLDFSDINTLGKYIKSAEEGKWKKSQMPALWDGNTGLRIITELEKLFG